MDNFLHIGTLGKPHGIKGAIVVYSKTQPETLIFQLPLITEDQQDFIFSKHEAHHNKVIGFLENNTDRNYAETLRNTKLYCNKDDFFTKFPQQVYHDVCQGYQVLSKDQTQLGILQEVIYIHDIPMAVVENNQQTMHLPLHIKQLDHASLKLQLDYSPQ